MIINVVLAVNAGSSLTKVYSSVLPYPKQHYDSCCSFRDTNGQGREESSSNGALLSESNAQTNLRALLIPDFLRQAAAAFSPSSSADCFSSGMPTLQLALMTCSQDGYFLYNASMVSLSTSSSPVLRLQ